MVGKGARMGEEGGLDDSKEDWRNWRFDSNLMANLLKIRDEGGE